MYFAVIIIYLFFGVCSSFVFVTFLKFKHLDEEIWHFIMFQFG